MFKPKRAEILQRFLDRKRIYTTDLFAAKYEEAARRNLHERIVRAAHFHERDDLGPGEDVVRLVRHSKA